MFTQPTTSRSVKKLFLIEAIKPLDQLKKIKSFIGS